jgi:hypothetical protein
MTRIEVLRPIAADPASVALLLADPSGGELWPGVHAVPPQRTATAFVAVLRLGEGDGGVAATLSLGYADSRDGVRATRASLRMAVDGEAGRAAVLREHAAAFLDRLASAAEARSYAA